MAALVRRYAKHTEDFHRKYTKPHEDWRLSGWKWAGGYRWFRAENVTPLEYYKRPSIDTTLKRTG